LDNHDSTRDPGGRFGSGNPGGPGRPKRRAYDLHRAGQEAVTPEHYATMIRKALRMALEGNLAAMKFVAERTVGRAPDAPAEAPALDIALPHLLSAVDCATAIDRIIAGISAGTVDLPTAKFLLDAVERRRKTIETVDQEERIVELEKAAESVDLGTR
jgi:hypothetical protein